jgi:predicted acetyltransferase
MTATVEIRNIDFAEIVKLGIGHYAFGATPSPRDLDKALARAKYYPHSTGWAVYEDGQALASCSMHTMTENVRGKILPMGGFGGVASLPEGRRKGYVRSMLVKAFAALRDQGIPVSTLYPFRDSFYERLGYAEFPKTRFTTLDPAHLAPLVRSTLPGEVDQREIGEAFDDWWTFLETIQPMRHGFAMFNRRRGEEWRDENQDWVALVREDGHVTGAMTFKITGYGKELVADSFHTTTAAARYQLLAWIGRHVDQVKEAVLELAPDAYPELWFRDLVAQSSTVYKDSWPGPMARVIDIVGITGIGAGDATASITLVDDQCPWNNGDWTLTGEGGGLTVTPGGTPGGHLTIQGLSGLVWTGMDPATFAYRGWGDPDAGTQAALQTLFPPAVPELYEKF